MDSVSRFFMSVCFSLCSLIIMGVILYLFIKRKRNLETENKMFYTLIVYTIVLLLFEFIRTYFLFKIGDSNPITMIITKLDVFLMFVWEFFFTGYLNILCKRSEYVNKFKELKKKTILFLSSTTVFSLLITIFMKLEFLGVDRDDIAFSISGPLVYALYIFTILVFIFASFILTKNKESIINVFITPLYLVFESLIVIILLKLIFPNMIINILVPFFVLTIAVSYLTIESQDSKLLYEYKKAKEDAKIASKAQNEFLINMSHEIRTPMNTIIGFSESILKENTSSSNINGDLDNIKEANSILNDLINNLLDISRIESNEEKVNKDIYKLDDLLCDVNEYVYEKLNNKELRFNIELDKQLPNYYYGDYKKVYKSIIYTIENAIEYTNYGEIKLTVNGNIINNNILEFAFIVANSGHAMTNDSFNKDFEDYISIDNASQNNKSTIKLGLIIAKRLTKMMGGKIEFLNEKNNGTRYFVRIRQQIANKTPIGSIDNKLSASLNKINSYYDFSGKNVLLIDDEAINIRLITNYLKPYNLNVTAVSNSEEAAELFKNNKYDLILLDFNIEGLESSDIIKSFFITGFRIPPIIALVANELEIIDVDYYKIGFNDYLVKPFNLNLLKKCLLTYLNSQGVNKQ